MRLMKREVTTIAKHGKSVPTNRNLLIMKANMKKQIHLHILLQALPSGAYPDKQQKQHIIIL